MEVVRNILDVYKDSENENKAIVTFDKTYYDNGKEVNKTYTKTSKRSIKKIGDNKFQIVFDKVIYTFSWKRMDDGKYIWSGISHSKRYGEKEVVKEEEPKKEEEVKEYEEKEVNHNKYEEIKTCIECDIPVYLYGPAGSGKNHVLEQIAWDLGLDFYFTNSVQQEYKITGFIDAGGIYHETEFYKAFTKGGVFLLDEIDASIPEVLVLLNAAIANRYFEFPNGRVQAHEDFRVVSAGNTVGSGADEMYTGRLVLDQATLDRFACIEFGYDENVEMNISKGNKELVDFIHDIRKQSEDKGVRSTFSYRCISMVTKLEEKGMSLETILRIAVFKGMDKDTLNTFEVKITKENKYMMALNSLKTGVDK